MGHGDIRFEWLKVHQKKKKVFIECMTVYGSSHLRKGQVDDFLIGVKSLVIITIRK